MPPRAYWTGNLKLSLVTLGVRLYNATTASGRIQLHQVHAECRNRLRFPPTCPVHGIVPREEIAKAYEYEKDHYVIIDQEDLDRIGLRSSQTVELTRFAKAAEFDPLYVDSPYFVAPDGPVATEGFGVIREAMRKTGTVGIGTLALAGKERMVSLRPEGRGFVLCTLLAADEVRKPETYFDEIPVGAVDKGQLSMVEALIKSKTAKFDPGRFHDRYQDALREIVKAKVEGAEPIVIHEEEAAPSYSFMEALKKSLVQAGGTEKGKKLRKPAAKSVRPAAKRRKQA